MVSCCAVKGCKTRSTYEPKISFYRMPAEISSRNRSFKLKDREKMQKLSKIRQEAWIRALKRKTMTPTQLKNTKICERHFLSGK